jgi:hypothetical protein
MSTNSEIFDSFEPFKLFESFNLLLDLQKNAQESRFYGKDDIVRYADDAIKKMKNKVQQELAELGKYRQPSASQPSASQPSAKILSIKEMRQTPSAIAAAKAAAQEKSPRPPKAIPLLEQEDEYNSDADYGGSKRGGLSKSYKKRINKNKRTKRNRK